MAERKFLQVYHNWLDAMEDLDDAERGRLFTALLTYSMTGVRPELEGNERYVFRCLSWFVDQDRDAYERRCEVNRANGRKGGRPRERAAEPVSEAPAALQSSALQSTALQPAPREETPQPAALQSAARTEQRRQEEPNGSSFSAAKPIGGQQEEEKEKEQKQKEEHSPLYPPDWGERLTRTAQSWLAYKREKGQAYRPRGEKKLIEQISSYAERFGQEAVAGVIEESMASNYQGITWDRLNARTPKSVRTAPGVRPAGTDAFDADYLAWMQAVRQKVPLQPPDSFPAGPPGGA